MVYQHIPRVNRSDFFLEVAHKMADLVQPQHISLISDNSIAFFFITKSADTGREVDGILKRYASKTTPKLCFLVPGAGFSQDICPALNRRQSGRGGFPDLRFRLFA